MLLGSGQEPHADTVLRIAAAHGQDNETKQHGLCAQCGHVKAPTLLTGTQKVVNMASCYPVFYSGFGYCLPPHPSLGKYNRISYFLTIIKNKLFPIPISLHSGHLGVGLTQQRCVRAFHGSSTRFWGDEGKYTWFLTKANTPMLHLSQALFGCSQVGAQEPPGYFKKARNMLVSQNQVSG